jgi:tetratricopeptide (TPR) repeat protein/tRNA A-37 threonylcarbamoyl transferase component Bud32
MTPARWRQVEELFNKALAVPTGQRRAWLEESCAGDDDLHRTVLEMLEADEGPPITGSPIEGAIHQAASSVLERDGIGAVPRRLGAYEILREIGSGGMSTVYLATRADDQYRKQVAVKMIHRALAKDSTLERFLQERQILANLDHPYVARLIDGGAASDGRPYLILEYVEGEPITTYCVRNKLGINDRCRLFVRVCEAIAYAHQNLIIHRDLKPGNILVSTDGIPKLLDFGIAKLMDEQDTTRDPITRAATSLMTPEYASPEQVRGQPATTATDVYSLGAVLFEILSGERAQPVGSASPTEMVRVICEREVTKPSRVSKERISTDLDNIVLKAMEKDPRRRYGSVEQMADDIHRYLDNLPVKARGNSPLYVMRKFMVRHWIPAAAMIVTIAALAGGTVMARREAAEAVRQRDRAEAERVRAEHAANEAQQQRQNAQLSAAEANQQRERASKRFEQLRTLIHRFLFEIDEAVMDLPGTSSARRLVAKTALEYLDGMSKENAGEPALRRDLAVAYERVADLQGSSTRASLGDREGALATYAKALALRRSGPLNSAQARRELILLYENIGMLEGRANRADAVRTFKEGMKLASGQWKDDPLVSRAYAAILYQSGHHAANSQEALRSFSEAEKIYTRLIDQNHNEPTDTRVALALTQMQLGQHLVRGGDFAKGIPTLHRSVATLDEQVRQDEVNTRYRRNLGVAMNVLGSAYLDRTGGTHRNFDQALHFMNRSRQLFEKMAAEDPANRTVEMDLIRATANVGRAHSGFDKWEEATRYYSEALAKLEPLIRLNPNNRTMLDESAGYLMEIGTADFRLGNLDQADVRCRRAGEIWSDLYAKGSNNKFHHFNSALAVRRLGDIALARGNRDEARLLYQRALGVFEELSAADRNISMFQYQIKMSHEAMEKLDAVAAKGERQK